MADAYAVVQKRRAPVGAVSETSGPSIEDAPLYSQVTPRAQRPGADKVAAAQAEDKRNTLPGQAPANHGSAWPSTYEDVADGVQTGGLGFNVRIGRPKGPRDPPAEWTRV